MKLIVSNSIVLSLINTRPVLCDGSSDRLLSDSKLGLETQGCVFGVGRKATSFFDGMHKAVKYS